MDANPLFFFLAALIPLAVGFIWYHPKVLGTAWGKTTGLPQEVLDKGPKPAVFVISYILSLLLAFMLYPLTVHQGVLPSLFNGLAGFEDPGSAVHQQFLALQEQFAGKNRNFGHGAMHAAFAALFIAFPVLAINSMFDRRSWKHIMINVGYWVITMALMGGVICQFA